MKNISKKAVSYLFALLIVISSFVIVPKIFAIVNPTLTISSINTTNSSHISVPITASNFKNRVAGMDLLISYDPALLQINSITPNNSLDGASINKDYSSNLIYISYLANVDKNFSFDNGIIATLNFTVISNSNVNTNLTFKTIPPGLQSGLYNKFGSDILTNFVNGVVNIIPLPIPTLSSISITHGANKTSYTVGDTFDITGLEITGYYSDGSSAVLPITNANISGFYSLSPVINQNIIITFNSKTTNYLININPLIISTPTLTIGSFTAVSGSHISVPITVSDFKDKIAGMDLLINFNPNLLSIDSIDANDILRGISFNKDYSTDLIYLGFLADTNTTFNLDNGIIATLNFTVKNNSNTNTNLTFNTTSVELKSALYDKYGLPILANFVDGVINLNSIPQITKKAPISSQKKLEIKKSI